MSFKHYQYLVDPSVDSPDFRQFLSQITCDHHRYSKCLKHDGTTTVSLARLKTQSCVVKRYNTKNKLHFVRRLFRKSRAQNCWAMSAIFQDAGILTSQRMAVVQECFGPLKLRSWYISEYIEADDLDHFLEFADQAEQSRLILEQTKTEIRRLFERFAQHRLSHGDLKASNILVFKNQLYLIDLDAAHQHSFDARFERAAHKDWARFMKNWQNNANLSRLFSPVAHSLPHIKL